MALPCINDTCSITATISDVNNRANYNVRLDPAGGLTCGTDDNPNAGLRVNTNPCNLDVDVNGLVTIMPAGIKAGALQSGANAVDIPESTGGGEATVVELAVTNPYDCRALIFIESRYEVKYNTTGTYQADFVFRTLNDLAGTGLAAGEAATSMPVAGVTIGGEPSTHDFWQTSFGISSIAGGDTANFTMDVRAETIENVTVSGNPYGASGHIKVTIFPFNTTTLP